MITTMGLGLHECKHDGTKNVIVFFGETPCEYVHSHIDSNGHIYCHKHAATVNNSCDKCDHYFHGYSYVHTGNCCSTTSYVLTVAQLLQDKHIDFTGNQFIAIQYNYNVIPNFWEYDSITNEFNVNTTDDFSYKSVSLSAISCYLI